MKRFITKLIIFSLPFIILSGLAYFFDPYKVFSPLNDSYIYTLPLNDRYLKTEFLKTHPGYDTFIFGSSIAHAFKTEDLQKHRVLADKKIYNYSVLGESIYGIEKKLDFLIKQQFKIKKTIIILDASTLSKTSNRDALIFREHPLLSDELFSSFYIRYLSVLFNPTAVKDFLSYGRRDISFRFDLKSGDHYYLTWDDKLKNNPEAYYKDKWAAFQATIKLNKSHSVIGSDQLKILKKMAATIKANGIDAKIIIAPLYQNNYGNDKDITVLKTYFENVYDFSSTENIINNYQNFYDPEHFRPTVAKQMVDVIFPE